MSLNRLFDTIEETRTTANWRSAFGEPQVAGDVTMIPVARVGYAYGLGFGSGEPQQETDAAASPVMGGGGGGGASAKPLGALVITPDQVYFQETEQSSKIALAGMLFVAFLVWQLGKTLRAILSRA
jgi:uncharacterized spore protein YtfJ